MSAPCRSLQSQNLQHKQDALSPCINHVRLKPSLERFVYFLLQSGQYQWPTWAHSQDNLVPVLCIICGGLVLLKSAYSVMPASFSLSFSPVQAITYSPFARVWAPFCPICSSDSPETGLFSECPRMARADHPGKAPFVTGQQFSQPDLRILPGQVHVAVGATQTT